MWTWVPAAIALILAFNLLVVLLLEAGGSRLHLDDE
jgi:hypothetical protein